MPLAEDKITHPYSITAYEDDSISVSDVPYKDSFMVSPTALNPWDIHSIEGLSSAHMQALLDMQPEVVLIGTGLQQQFPTPQAFAFFSQHGIGLEVMTNAAACRTFNILAAEDRHVVCGFIL